MSQTFFADHNIRKWLLQIIRQFSEFNYQFLDNNGNTALASVPVIWGDQTFSAATVARMNSENVMPTFPLISIYISNLKYDRERVQTPTFVDTLNVRTRKYDFATNSYLPEQGNAYTIKRLMPVPYSLDIKLDLVTSNTQQKLQILEQILPLYNPALELQKTDNYLDWESLSYIELTDVNWSNRSIPVGSGNDSSYDVCTLSFRVPIWMSLPAQVSKMGVIFQVITDINGATGPYLQDILFSTRKVVTFNNYGIFVYNGQIRIMNEGNSYPGANANISSSYWNPITNGSKFLYGPPLDWGGVLDTYGNIGNVVNGITQIGLGYGNNKEILGTITLDPLDSTVLLYNVDPATLPSNTLPAINMVVNPQEMAPNIGLPPSQTGQSYLLTANIGTNWPYDTSNSSTSAYINDIITYDGNGWITTFSSANNFSNTAYVYDLNANLQYVWNGNLWADSWQGMYTNEFWRLIL